MKLNSIVKVEKKEVKCFCVDILEANPEDTPCRCGARDNKLHNQGQEDYGNREIGLSEEKIIENILATCEEELNKTIGFMLTKKEAELFAQALVAKEGSLIVELK